MHPDLQLYAGGAGIVDIKWLLRELKASYWGAHYTRDMLMCATERSVCISAFIRTDQVGFARVVTDGAIVSALTDVIVDGKWRGQGIGRRLLEAVFDHPQVKPTICILQARPENFGLYQKFGFVPVGSFMKRDPR